MALYTRSGDDGFTVRGDGQRVSKADAVVEAVGAVDELSAALGACLAEAERCGAGAIAGDLNEAQRQLFAVGAVLAGAPAAGGDPGAAVGAMERRIDEVEGALPRLRAFILPGGCELACRLHGARTVCRRAERRVAAVGSAAPAAMQYLNRLSDLLFVLARLANRCAGVAERPAGE